MLPLRFVGLLVILFAVHAWCKPAKSNEGVNYSDDDPPPDYNDDDTADDNDPGSIEEPPQIMSKPESIRVRNGSTIWLPCLVKNADNFAVTWKRNDETLYLDSIAMTVDSERIVRLPNNTLVIHNVTTNDTSEDYECSILQKSSTVTIKHRVLVEDAPAPAPHKPLIRVIPRKRVEVNAGESVTLGCETRIQPTPQIKWYRENMRIHADEMPGNRITIQNVSRHDSGRYRCLLEDGSEKPPLETIVVVVNYAPEIEAKSMVHTGLGVESDLTCIVHAHPHVTRVAWYKDQTEILPDPGRIEIKSDKNPHTLKILHTEQKDLGTYTCVATNKLGRTEKSVVLTGLPSQATIYSCEVTRTGTGLVLKWRLESYSPITEYKLQYRRSGDNQWMVLKPSVTNGKGNQFTVEHVIEDLQPGSYETIITARNDFGWSQPSEPHVFTGDFEEHEAERVKGPSGAASHPAIAIATLFLVVSSCAFTSL
ncbi:opioid-binding protein/cell adhesion molecule homolog [Colletes latitarsis]|uniref:opioid-binding protein/cell adhesion molecule homolog n=1 Tax=Colletes latitarsis TaxID=2605962 RepID=UPI0040350849